MFVFVMSMKAFCREKITVTDVTSIRFVFIFLNYNYFNKQKVQPDLIGFALFS